MKRPLSQYAKGTALASHIALMIALVAQGSTLSWLGALLLAPPLPGLVRGRIYTYQWSCMLVAFFCALWLAEAWFDPRARVLAVGIAALAALDFIGLVLYVRLQGRERAAPGAASAGASR